MLGISAAALPTSRLPVRMSVPVLASPPPRLSANPSRTVRPETVAFTPAPISKTRLTWLPLTATRSAPRASDGHVLRHDQLAHRQRDRLRSGEQAGVSNAI